MQDEVGLPYLYEMLEAESQRLDVEIQNCSILEAEATLIGQQNQVRFGIVLLKKCENFGVLPSSDFVVLPDTISPSSEYRVMEDVETDDPRHWTELTTPDDRLFRLYGGSVVIR
ncbi:MAG: hypothetical protein JKY56_16550 [Kofleriaceae bacterium]|nr:hypothetical protein [Kofleriaceae bacterium]